MMIRMVHPNHGEMHVYDEQQKVLNENRGWKTVPEPSAVVAQPPPTREPDLEEVMEPPKEAVTETNNAIGISDDIRQQYIVKFGKPPHHRMKPESIERAVKEDA